MKIALASPPYPKSIDDGLFWIETLIKDAVNQHAEIICFPESYIPGYPGMGVAELDAASCRGAFAGRLSGRAHPRLGLRRDAARNSSRPKSSWEASPPQYYSPCRRRRGSFYRCGILSLAACLSAQDRQIDRGSAVSELKRSKGERVFRRRHPE